MNRKQFLSIFMFLALVATVQGSGYIPSGQAMSQIEQAWTTVGHEPKGTVLDWRDSASVDYMSPVQDQAMSNLCWAFASTHVFESQVRINDYPSAFTKDFSEDALADCTIPGGSTEGGNYYKAAGFFSSQGPTLEDCQAWDPGTTECLSCPKQDYRLKTMISIANTPAAIKAALVNGPVGCAIDTGAIAGFSTYDGSSVITSASSPDPNHTVIICGYHEGTGDPGYFDGDYWIVKNSWGTGWGDNGYFYISYDLAGIGVDAMQFTEWEDSLPSQGKVLVHEDENGSTGFVDVAQNTIYICQRLVPGVRGEISSIQWTNLGNNFDYEIRIYNDFETSFGLPLNLLYGPYTGTNEPHGGILTLDLPSGLSVTPGDDLYVCIKLDNPLDTLHAVDYNGAYSGSAYYSLTSMTSGYANNAAAGIPYDWGVRLVVTNFDADLPATGPIGIAALILLISCFIIYKKN